jgi:DNA invertase Pin-like site-specific DNA recombinase
MMIAQERRSLRNVNFCYLLNSPDGILDAWNGGFAPGPAGGAVAMARRQEAVPVACAEPGCGTLVLWAEQSGRRRAQRLARGTLRFAFYGRVSTEDWRDPVTSRAGQHAQAESLVRGVGMIVAEFFDIGQSRTVALARRPQAAALVAALADPDRGWDAIVVGEYERAFYGSQYAVMAPLFEHYGVQLWMPEAGGRVDYASEHDERAMTVLGLSSKREVARTSIRVRTAMAAQAREQGRYLGGPRRTSAGWLMRVRIRTRRMLPGGGGRTGWSRTWRPRTWCGGFSPSGWPGIRWRGSRGR